MDPETQGFLAGAATAAGIYAVYFAVADAIQTYRIKRKAYGSAEELDHALVMGYFSHRAKKWRRDQYEQNPRSLERPPLF